MSSSASASASGADSDRDLLSGRLDAARAAVRSRTSIQPRVGIVLGSGLGGLVDQVQVDARVAYDDIPHFRTSTVTGHAGELIVGRLAGANVAVLSGRLHLYEGYSPADVVFPVRLMVRLGAEVVVVTNAAGGIHPDFKVRDVMVMTDQINLTGQNPLVGPNDDTLGPRFVDMTAAFDPELRARTEAVARELGFTLRRGVYAGLLGPSYETPAEIRMLRTLGADAVGMSTVHEVIAARHLGARVVGLSCITNAAAGLSEGPLDHDDVKAVAGLVGAELVRLVNGLVASLAQDPDSDQR